MQGMGGDSSIWAGGGIDVRGLETNKYTPIQNTGEPSKSMYNDYIEYTRDFTFKQGISTLNSWWAKHLYASI